MRNNYSNKRIWDINIEEQQQQRQEQEQQQLQQQEEEEEHSNQSAAPSVSSSFMNRAKRFRRGDETITTFDTMSTNNNNNNTTTTVPHIQNTTIPSTSTSSSATTTATASSTSTEAAAAGILPSNEMMEDDVIIVDDDIVTGNKFSGDFHSDTGLSPMYLHSEKNRFGNEYRVIVDHCVMTGIMDHVFSDSENEVLGLLGGVYDEQKNLVHVKHYCASIRQVDNISIDGVECDGNEVVKAQNNFSEKGLGFVGWYHSHPR
jgi:hypothetical protein